LFADGKIGCTFISKVKAVPKPRLAEQAFDGAGRHAVRLGRIDGRGNKRRKRHVHLLWHEAQMSVWQCAIAR
jgi:hypothetical protein